MSAKVIYLNEWKATNRSRLYGDALLSALEEAQMEEEYEREHWYAAYTYYLSAGLDIEDAIDAADELIAMELGY